MSSQFTILAGPARSGKTTRLLAEYRKVLAAGPLGCALWLGPNRCAIGSVYQQLLDGNLGHCANPQCMTFGQFAQQVLDASAAPLRSLSELMKRQLLRELIARGVKEGELVHFGPIADTPGLLQLVSQAIREWKRLDIWPDELLSACDRHGLTQKDRELLWLYRQYQQLLNDHGLYDAEGRSWLARERLREGQRRPFERVTHVFADGFADFTRAEHEVLTLLAQRATNVMVTLPLEQEVGNTPAGTARSELFAKPLCTFRELERRHSSARVEWLPRRATDWRAMHHIEGNVFKSPAEVQPLADAAGIEIIAAAGHLNEIEGLARQIKLLLAGETAAPQDILVVFRSVGDAASLVREVFDRFGIPVAVEAPTAVGSAPCISSLVAWLRLVADDWPFRPLLAILSHNSFHPSWTEWQSGRATVAAERLVREFQLPSGRIELTRRVSRLAAPLKDGEPAPVVGSRRERRIGHARLAAPLLDKLSQTLAALPTSATPGDWCRALSRLANEVGIARLVVNSPRETVAWEALMSSLRSVDRLAAWTGATGFASAGALGAGLPTPPLARTEGLQAAQETFGRSLRRGQETRAERSDVRAESERGSSKLTLRELLDLIVEIAQTETLPPEHDDVGRVRVVGAMSARVLSAPYVFLAGLTEKAFPAAEREDRLYSDTESARLTDAGLPLTTRRQRSQEEMLLFYEVVTRATRKLVMSYPGLDAKAQPLSPSPYLVELERACGEGRIPHRVDLQLSPVPREQAILCERDLRVRAVADALDGDRKLLAGVIQRSGTVPVTNLLTSLQTTHLRSRGSGFGPFEGVFLSDTAREHLAARFGPERCWSPSQLEKYAYCPFQFFAERVMRLEPLGQLELEVNHQLRGKLLHGTLSGVHRKIVDEAGKLGSHARQPPETFERAAAEVLSSLLEQLITDDPITLALQDVDRRVLGEWLVNYYTQHQDYDALWSDFEAPLRPAHFEVSFGPPHDSSEGEPEEVSVDCDTLMTLKPLELRHGNQTVRVRGRIDRVDVGEIGGRTVFNVIDYKSASEVRLSSETVAAGLTLQLPLYALAVEQLLLIDQQAIPWRASYWLVKEKGFRHRSALAFYQLIEGQLELDDSWAGLRDQLLARVVSLVRGIQDGQFPMHCADDKCTGRCPYHTMCRVGQVRALEKTWQPPEDGA